MEIVTEMFGNRTDEIRLSLLSLIALELAVLIQYTVNETQGMLVRSLSFFASYGSIAVAVLVLLAIFSGGLQTENQ